MELFKPKPRLSSREKIRKAGLETKFGLAPVVAKNLDKYVFNGPGWNDDVFLDCFEKIEGFEGDVKKFQVVDRSYRQWIRGRMQWVKPDPDLIKQAAIEKKALCVNKDGQFQLLESGFVALSHTWTEGLYADAGNRGLPRHIIDQLFELLVCIPEAEWVWIDSLAVPGGDRDLSVDEEKIKVQLINNMGVIYKR